MTNRKAVKKVLKIAFCFLFFVFCFPGKMLAADFDISFSPPVLEAMIKPGKKINQVYWITNRGQRQSYIPLILPMTPSGLQGGTKLSINPFTAIENKNNYFLSYPFLNWFSLQNIDIKLGQSFVLEEGEKKQLVLKINIPENSKLIDYYVTFLILPSAGDNTILGSAGKISGGIGSQILLTVSEKEPEGNLDISEFNGPKWCLSKSYCLPIIDMFDQAKFELTAENKGQHLQKASGSVSFYKNSQKIDVNSIIPVNILADSRRRLQPAQCRIKNDCTYFSFQPNALYLGKIRAEAELFIAPGSKKVYIYYVLPIKAVFALILIASLYYFVKYSLTKLGELYKNRQDN